jgi:hypothetical protein
VARRASPFFFKAEVDVFDGAATVSPLDNPGGIEQKWTLFAVKAVAHF